jgi:transcription initiation factor TFIIH subunit 2
MLKTVLLLDGSSTMNATVDYLPTRLLALKPQLQQYIRTYLDLSPLSQLGTVVMRDTTAHVLTPLTNSAAQLTEGLELRYFLQGGSGAMSLECGLRTSLSQLVELRKKKGLAGGGALQVVLFTASVSLVDGGDVRSIVEMLRRSKIRVDIVHLVGSVYALQQLAEQTGGQHFCPMNYEHLREIVAKLPYEVSGDHRKKRLRDEDNDEDDRLVPIGFPQLAAALEVPGKSYLLCPRCKLPLQGIPCVCPLCSLLVTSLPFIHMSYIWRNQLVPDVRRECEAPSSAVENNDIADGVTTRLIKCSLCDVDLISELEGGAKVLGSSLRIVPFSRCTVCKQPRCDECSNIVSSCVGLCPSCIA